MTLIAIFFSVSFIFPSRENINGNYLFDFTDHPDRMDSRGDMGSDFIAEFQSRQTY